MSNSGVTDEHVLRVMGLDYGSKTVGIAISDLLGVTAQPVETVFRKKENHLRRTLARIDELIEEARTTDPIYGMFLDLIRGGYERKENVKELKLSQSQAYKITSEGKIVNVETQEEVTAVAIKSDIDNAKKKLEKAKASKDSYDLTKTKGEYVYRLMHKRTTPEMAQEVLGFPDKDFGPEHSHGSEDVHRHDP